VVDDEYLISEGLRLQVEGLGVRVCGIAATADDAIALAQTHRPRVVLMDVRLGGDKDGVDAALAIHETVGSRVIFITGSREPQTLKRIEADHAWAILYKPVAERQFTAALTSAMG
jgi:DNA-binding NarL/FixJ family response regulator